MFLMSEESFVNKPYYNSCPFMNSKYGLEQEYSLPQEYYNSDFINYPNIKVELKYNPTYYEGSLCILPSKKVSLPRYIGGSTTQPIYKYLKQYCKVTGKMDEYNEFVQSPFLEESIVKDVSEYVPHIPSEVSGANVDDSTSSQTQIKQSKEAAQPQSPSSSVSETPLEDKTPSSVQSPSTITEPYIVMNDESKKQLNNYIINILSFLKNREQVESPLPPSSSVQSPSTITEPYIVMNDESKKQLNKYIINILSFLKNREQVESPLPSKATGKALSSAEVAEEAAVEAATETEKNAAEAKEARVEAENKGAAEPVQVAPAHSMPAEEESIAKNAREEAKKAANNRTNTAHTSNRTFRKTYKILFKILLRLREKGNTLRNPSMIKDNEANIKAYEEEIRQLQIREKKLANNTRKKNIA